MFSFSNMNRNAGVVLLIVAHFFPLVFGATASLELTADAASSSELTALAGTLSALYFPPCASVCASGVLNNTTCASSSLECFCTDSNFQSAVESCVKSSCSVKEQLTTRNLTDSLCGVTYPDLTGNFNAIVYSLVALCGVSIVLRVGARIATFVSFWWDDVFAVFAFMTIFPLVSVNASIMFPNGFGKDIWRKSFDQLTELAHGLYLEEIIYVQSTWLYKLPFLCFYMRLSPGPPRIVNWASFFLVGVYAIAFTTLFVAQCNPIETAWTGWDVEHPGKCIPVVNILIANAAVNMALDIWLTLIPILCSFKFQDQDKWKKNPAMYFMFAFGAFIIGVTFYRLLVLTTSYGPSSNPLADPASTVSIHLSSAVEIATAILCFNFPPIYLLARDKLWGKKKQKNVCAPYDHRTSAQGRSSRLSIQRRSFRPLGDEEMQQRDKPPTYSQHMLVLNGDAESSRRRRFTWGQRDVDGDTSSIASIVDDHIKSLGPQMSTRKEKQKTSWLASPSVKSTFEDSIFSLLPQSGGLSPPPVPAIPVAHLRISRSTTSSSRNPTHLMSLSNSSVTSPRTTTAPLGMNLVSWLSLSTPRSIQGFVSQRTSVASTQAPTDPLSPKTPESARFPRLPRLPELPKLLEIIYPGGHQGKGEGPQGTSNFM